MRNPTYAMTTLATPAAAKRIFSAPADCEEYFSPELAETLLCTTDEREDWQRWAGATIPDTDELDAETFVALRDWLRANVGLEPLA